MISKFPVTYSLVSPEALEKRFISLYSLPKGTRIEFLHQGINDTYLIDTSPENFILRIYRTAWRTVDEIEGELDLLLMLHKSGINVSYPVADKEGKFIQLLDCPEGIRFAVTFTYALGESLRGLDSHSAHLFGQYMATLHKTTGDLNIEKLSMDYTVAGILKNTKKNFQLTAVRDEGNRIENVCHQLQDKLSPVALMEVRSGICHVDVHYENVFLDHPSGKITMFDFDFCGLGYLLYDLGSFCRYERNSQDNKNAFFEGYEQITPLNDAEKNLLPYFEVLMRFFHLGARLNNADGIKNPKWAKEDVRLTIGSIADQLSNVKKAETEKTSLI